MEVFVMIAGLMLAFVVYFLPALIAGKKKCSPLIFLINLLLGWTAVGWVVALILAIVLE